LRFQPYTDRRRFLRNYKNGVFMLEELNQQQADLEKKIAQIRARIELKQARQSNPSRKLDTRRKIILGGYQLARMKDCQQSVITNYLKTVAASPNLRAAERQVIVDWLAELGG
jgi:hypothetical protein